MSDVQQILTVLATGMEVGFGLWFLIAFPLFCRTKLEAERLTMQGVVMAQENQGVVLDSQPECGNPEAVTPEGLAESERWGTGEIDSMTAASIHAAIETKSAEFNGDTPGVTGKDLETGTAIDGDEKPVLDLREVQLLQTPTKVAVKEGDLKAMDVALPSGLRRKRVSGQVGYDVRDLKRSFQVLLPEGVGG